MKPSQRIVGHRHSRYACFRCRRVWTKSIWKVHSPAAVKPEQAEAITRLENDRFLYSMAAQVRRQAGLVPFQKDFLCSVCGTTLVDMGRYFRAPRRNNRAAWRNIEAYSREQRQPQRETITPEEALKRTRNGQPLSILERPFQPPFAQRTIGTRFGIREKPERSRFGEPIILRPVK